MENYQPFLDVAEESARLGGEILVKAFGQVDAREKAPFDLVTDADLASQRAIQKLISERFPEHTMLAEEEGVEPEPDRPYRWIVDPLDGTINFAHQLPIWCVSVALEHQGELVAGAIWAPLLDQFFSAAKGQGATLNGQPIRVSTAPKLAKSLIATGMPTAFEADAERQLAWFRQFSIGTHSVRRTGTAAWNLAMVAAGRFDVCYGTPVQPWDVAAGVLLVREAGGQITTFNGSSHDLYGPELLASNGEVHEESVQTIATAWPEPAKSRS